MPTLVDRPIASRTFVDRQKGQDPSGTMLDMGAAPERALWMAVIWQAVADAKGDDPSVVIPARYFLLGEGDSWAASRAQVCTHAGIDPDWLRRKMAAVFGREPI